MVPARRMRAPLHSRHGRQLWCERGEAGNVEGGEGGSVMLHRGGMLRVKQHQGVGGGSKWRQSNKVRLAFSFPGSTRAAAAETTLSTSLSPTALNISELQSDPPAVASPVLGGAAPFSAASPPALSMRSPPAGGGNAIGNVQDTCDGARKHLDFQNRERKGF